MDQGQGDDTNQYFISEISTRLRDVEERIKLIKERTHVLGKNFVETKQESIEEIKNIKQRLSKIEEDIEKIKSASNFLIKETGKYAKKEELALIERMLKDFQPLEFVRIKDLNDILPQRINKQKNINSKNIK